MVVVRKSFTEGGAKLYICSTPIGNLADVSLRLLETLRQVDVLAAEDTRHTRKLLSKYDIHIPQLISYHQHNARARADEFQALWAQGKSIALVSDAGTPGVSDPGILAVQMAIDVGIPVIPIPGASAVLSALVGSGLSLQPFLFSGFLPREKKQCDDVLKGLLNFQGVLVFYEAPHRLLATMKRINEAFSDKRGVLAKELTKQHETFIYGLVHELLSYVESEPARGEYVIMIDAKDSDTVGQGTPEKISIEQAAEQVGELMKSGFSHTDAVKQVSIQTGLKRRLLYNETIQS